MYVPTVINDGYSGWKLLQRTYDRQTSAFQSSAAIQRDTSYFSSRVREIESAEELVNDRRLLSVALGAFGLSQDVDNKFFIQRILEEGTIASDALGNKLADDRYAQLSSTFGFGPGEVQGSNQPGFAESIVDRYEAAKFEAAIGEQNDSFRIALYAQRTLPDIASSDQTIDGKWFTIMGEAPLRSFFETALGLPPSFSQIELDQQLRVFKDRSRDYLGFTDLKELTDTRNFDELLTKFISRNQLNNVDNEYSPASIALSLLRTQ